MTTPRDTPAESSTTAAEPLGSVEDLVLAKSLACQLVEGKGSVEEVCSSGVVKRISKRLEQVESSLESQRTAKLWFCYMNMVDILRRSIKAERTGNWNLHLQ